jgi:hypothetical protein
MSTDEREKERTKYFSHPMRATERKKIPGDLERSSTRLTVDVFFDEIKIHWEKQILFLFYRACLIIRTK